MILIVGLGNPGLDYRDTRHNFGFMALDAFAADCGTSFRDDKKFQAEVGECTLESEKVILAKPTTFMNLSGKAVAAIARFYKIAPEHIWIVADDLDLPLGRIRVRLGGESGGHHGLDSIAAELGTKGFGRIRLGVRGDALRQEHQSIGIQGQDFVMGKFTPRELPARDATLALTVQTIKDSLAAKSLDTHTRHIEGFTAE